MGRLQERRCCGSGFGHPGTAGVPLHRRGHEAGEQRVGRRRLALELGMKLDSDEPGMVGQLDDLHEGARRVRAGDHEPRLLQGRPVLGIELVAVPVSFGDSPAPVGGGRPRALDEDRRLGPESHRAPLVHDRVLLVHEADHGVGCVAVELGRVGGREARHVPGHVDHRALHPQADAEEGQPPLAGEPDRLHLALDAALTEPARHEQAVEAGEEPLRPLPLDVLTLDWLHADLRPVGDATVVEGLVDALVGVAVLGVLANQRDRHLVLGIPQPMEDVVPLLEVGWRRLDAEPPQDDLVDAIRLQRQGHLVDRKVLVTLLDHGVERHVAKERDLLAVGDVEAPFGAADEDVRLDTDLAEDAHRVLGGLGLQFAGGLEVGHEREVDEDAVFPAHLHRDLADRLQERQALDVAHRAADLGDRDIDVGRRQLRDDLLDLVGDVGDHLYRLAEELAPPFLVDHREVDLAGRVVALASQRGGREPLVMAEIEIGLASVVEHVDLAVLVRAHRARIDVDVGIEFLHADPQAAGLEKHADRGGGEALAERADDAAGHENMLGHGASSFPSVAGSGISSRPPLRPSRVD